MSSTELLPRYLRIGIILVFAFATPASAWDRRLFRPLTPRNTQILLRSLSISKLPDMRKMNVSQEEYETKFQEYVRRLRETRSTEAVTTFHSLRHSDQSRRLSVDFSWAKNVTKDISQSSRIRVFIEGSDNAEIEIVRSEKLLERRYLQDLPKWIDVDSGTDWWEYKLTCKKCHISKPAVYVHGKKEGFRNRRHSETIGPTDCKPYVSVQKKHSCCRHQMEVVFNELPGYDFILQPFSFDAGYCKGRCPYRYNQANHHASLKSLIWRMKKGDAPKPCCAPSKLEPLQIIYLDENDPTKLKVATWTNMKVTACACF